MAGAPASSPRSALFGLVGIDATQAFTISLIAHVIPMLALSPGLLFLLRPATAAAGDLR